MAGIKALQYDLSAKATTGANQTAFLSLGVKISEYVRDVGYDPGTKGMRYGASFTMCEPAGVAPGWNPVTLISSPEFDWTVLGCQHGNSVVGGAVAAARALSAEAQTAMRLLYTAAPTTPNRNFADEFYGAIYGQVALTQPGFPTDGGYTNTYIDPSGLNAGKWLGFHFGVGMAHQWPAVRLGGRLPAVNRSIGVMVDPAAISLAVSVKVILTFPSGATTFTVCNVAGICPVVGDATQGDHMVTREYWSASGATGTRLAVTSTPADVLMR